MRTPTDVQNEMKAVIAAKYPELLPLANSNSKVSNFKMLMGLWGLLVSTQDGLLEQHAADMTTYVEANRAGTLAWYVRVAKEFQFGLNAVPNELGQYYSIVEESRRIVKLVSVKTGTPLNQDLIIKVLKYSNNLPAPLTSEELDAFKVYMGVAKVAGVKIDIQSLPINEVKFGLSVYHDRQVLNYLGQSLTDTTKYPVREAVKSYLLNLPFGGSFRVSQLIDFLLSQPGVLNVKVTDPQYLDGVTWTAFEVSTLKYDPPSGFLIMSDANMGTWTYTAEPF